MEIFAIDAEDSRVVTNYLPKDNPYPVHFFRIPKSNHETAFQIAKSINAKASKRPTLILLNIHINHFTFNDYFFGIELLKEIRATAHYEQPSKIQRLHVVLFSSFSLERLLKNLDAGFFLVVSPGTTLIKTPALPTTIDQLKILLDQKPKIRDLVPYFKVGDTLVEKRHGHANWWAAMRLVANYNMLCPNHLYQKESQDFLKNRSPEIRDAQFIHSAHTVNEDLKLRKINKINKKLELAQNHLTKSNAKKRIALIDDQADFIDPRLNIGWHFIYNLVLFGHQEGVFNILPQLSDDEILQKMEENFDCVLLDLMLEAADQNKNTEETRGAHLLRKIRNRFPMLPIIITTASNKAEKRKTLRQLGCDAFWIKEGIDEGLSQEESLSRMFDLVTTVQKLTDAKYTFLKHCIILLRQLENKENWWELTQWINPSSPLPASVNRSVIFGKLMQSLFLTRTFLQNQLMGGGYRTKLEEDFWLSGVIIKLTNIIEVLHGSGLHQGKNTLLNRKDYLGAYLFKARQSALKYRHDAPITFDHLINFIKAMFCYLNFSPTHFEYPVIDAPPFAFLEKMLANNPVCKKLFDSN